jgi:hypothetical protein
MDKGKASQKRVNAPPAQNETEPQADSHHTPHPADWKQKASKTHSLYIEGENVIEE